jgi:histone H3/H4
MLQEVAQLDKTSMDRFQAATIRRMLRKARNQLQMPDLSDDAAYDAIDRVAEAVTDSDGHPANHTDDALDALKALADERGYEDVASSDIGRFG